MGYKIPSAILEKLRDVFPGTIRILAQQEVINRSQEISDAEKILKTPVVSVVMLVYNHAAYLSEALNSILTQKTNFAFELVIGEDCSTDNSREILDSWQKKYPNIIRIISSSENVGMVENFCRVFTRCKGKYIAFCEGDDYWCDPEKLQRQVDVFENDPKVAMVYSRVGVQQGTHIRHGQLYGNGYPIYHDFWRAIIDGRCFVNTVSCMIRAEDALKLQNNQLLLCTAAPSCDTMLFLQASMSGHTVLLNRETAIYRILNESASNTQSIEKKWSYVARKLLWYKMLLEWIQTETGYIPKHIWYRESFIFLWRKMLEFDDESIHDDIFKFVEREHMKLPLIIHVLELMRNWKLKKLRSILFQIYLKFHNFSVYRDFLLMHSSRWLAPSIQYHKLRKRNAAKDV